MKTKRVTQIYLAIGVLILAVMACSSPATLKANTTGPPVLLSPLLPPVVYTVNSPIDTDTPVPTPTLASCQVTTGVEGGTVFLRRCPMCDVIGYVEEGDELDLSPTQPDDYWYQVIGRKNGAMAWIARRFCQEVEP